MSLQVQGEQAQGEFVRLGASESNANKGSILVNYGPAVIATLCFLTVAFASMVAGISAYAGGPGVSTALDVAKYSAVGFGGATVLAGAASAYKRARGYDEPNEPLKAIPAGIFVALSVCARRNND